MPCRSDYLEPNARERESKRAAKCFVLLATKIGVTVPKLIAKAAKDNYGNVEHADEITAALCGLCKGTPEVIIYDGRDKNMRKVADWWDEHQEADRKREREEAEEANRQKLAKQGRDKLSEEERDALGID